MGLIKLFCLALTAGLGVAADRFAGMPSVVAAALVLMLWLAIFRAWRHRAS